MCVCVCVCACVVAVVVAVVGVVVVVGGGGGGGGGVVADVGVDDDVVDAADNVAAEYDDDVGVGVRAGVVYVVDAVADVVAVVVCCCYS